MFSLTPAAAQQIKQAASASGATDLALRIAAKVNPDGSLQYGMGFDEPKDEDMRLDLAGIAVVIGGESQELLFDTVLDFVEHNARRVQFHFQRRRCFRLCQRSVFFRWLRQQHRLWQWRLRYQRSSPLKAHTMKPIALCGKVYLVGAGPGDPELLTLRAVRLLERADVVVYDHLVSSAVLDFVSPTAERIYAGKRRNEHTMRQEQINALLVTLAQQGKQVVRLKGGDPFIFGRGGEELQTLAAQSVAFEVVPGVTAASGVSSYAGIPLTHRDYAQSCLFVTGHLKDGTADLDWPSLVRLRQTVVIYMGLGGLPEICHQMMLHGAPPSLPIAVVQDGSIATQKVVTGTLADMPERVARAGLKSPCLTLIGDVVKLHHSLAWFKPVAPAVAPAPVAPKKLRRPAVALSV